ncbi:MAG: eCIS core domain-containing protein [Candidatus Promineifilaceae bacterium]
MSTEHLYDDKGKAKPAPSQETAEPEKETGPLTKSQVEGNLDAATLTRMQQTMGNAAVQRFLAQRSGSGPTDLDEETASAINAKRGSGQSLDQGVADKAGQTMGQDFSGVNVHTDSEADDLSQQLGAKAFTTGNDIFFKSGAYSPSSSEGQRLISHELTHVVQQGASPPTVQGKMKVNDPNDQYEAEADKVADTVMNQPDEAAVQRDDLEEDTMQLQEDEEDLRLKEDSEALAQRQDDEEIV